MRTKISRTQALRNELFLVYVVYLVYALLLKFIITTYSYSNERTINQNIFGKTLKFIF